jgi:hypothetical protein
MRTIKKAQTGDTISSKKPKTWQKMSQTEKASIKTKLGPEKFKTYKDSVSKDATDRANKMFEKNAATRGLTTEQLRASNKKNAKKPNATSCDLNSPDFSSSKCGISKQAAKQSKANFRKMKTGGMLKRADGSYSKRGLWDNIRKNKGSGKKPTAAMLKQERKIKSKK